MGNHGLFSFYEKGAEMGKSKQLEKINEYFNAWLKMDAAVIPRLFSKDVVYTECTGTVYLGRAQCERWFAEWNQKGRVLKWDILKTFEVGDTVIVQWLFECEFEKNIDSFKGVSLIEFNRQGLIVSVNEYYAKTQLEYPYGNITL